jgi:hypothetical protein
VGGDADHCWAVIGGDAALKAAYVWSSAVAARLDRGVAHGEGRGAVLQIPHGILLHDPAVSVASQSGLAVGATELEGRWWAGGGVVVSCPCGAVCFRISKGIIGA